MPSVVLGALLAISGAHALQCGGCVASRCTPRTANPQAVMQAAEAAVDQESIRWYLDSIGRHRLLTKTDECVLSSDVQELGRWQSVRESLEDQLQRTPTDVEWSQAVGFVAPEEAPDQQFQHQLDVMKAAKEKMINSNLRLVVAIAKKYANRGLGLQDLIQEGTLGLITAVDKFDPDHASQAKFSSYASWWIKQRVSRAVGKARCIRLPSRMPSLLQAITRARDEYRMVMNREPTHEELASSLQISVARLHLALSASRAPVSLDATLRSTESSGESRTLADVIPGSADPQQHVEERMQRQALARTIQSLSLQGRGQLLDARELAVICSLYDLLEDRGRPLTHEEAGARFGESAEWAEKVEKRALQKLKGRPQLRKLLELRNLAPDAYM